MVAGIHVGRFVVVGLVAGTEPMLRIKLIHVDVSLASLLKCQPVIETLEIDARQLRIACTDEGRYDIDDLITRFVPEADGPAAHRARFALYNLQVQDAQWRFDDRPVTRATTIDAVQLPLPLVSNLAAEVAVKFEPR